MINSASALYSFWSSFGIPAYGEGNIPDDAVLPYITYNITDPHWSDQASTFAKVWYRGTSNTAIATKVREIKQRIGDCISLPVDDGSIYLFPEENFAQFQEDEDGTKMAYLSLVQNSFTRG